MAEKLLLTREEIEFRLEVGLIGKTVSFETVFLKTVSGRMQRLSVEIFNGELMINFMIDRKRYEADIQYFVENLTIHSVPSITVKSVLRGAQM